MPLYVVRLSTTNYGLAFDVDGDGRPKDLLGQVDYINRFDQPTWGSGNVFIAHATLKADVQLEPDASFWTKPTGGSKKSISGLTEIGTFFDYYQTETFRKMYRCIPDGIEFAFASHLAGSNKYQLTHGIVDNVTGYPRGRSIVLKNVECSSMDEAMGRALRAEPDTASIPTYYWGYLREGTYRIDFRGQEELEQFIRIQVRQFEYRSVAGRWERGTDAAPYAQAYFRALDNIPQLNTNNIANLVAIVEGVNLLYDVWKGHISDIPTDLASLGKLSKEAWLQYRYVYNTTVADMEELCHYAEQLVDIHYKLKTSVRVRGRYADGEDVYGCSFSVAVADLRPPKEVLEALKGKWPEKLGLAFTPEVAWDMIPFSFVVDWFLPIGDWLHKICIQNRWHPLVNQNVWYTHSGHETENGVDIYYYARFLGHGYSGVPQFEEAKAAGATWIKRAADTLALFF